MCKQKDICTELGTDPDKWDKFGLLRTPDWMDSELDLFVSAVDDFLDGNRDACLNKIKRIKSKDGNTIKQIGIDNPFNRPPVNDNWCGLMDRQNRLQSKINAH